MTNLFKLHFWVNLSEPTHFSTKAMQTACGGVEAPLESVTTTNVNIYLNLEFPRHTHNYLRSATTD